MQFKVSPPAPSPQLPLNSRALIQGQVPETERYLVLWVILQPPAFAHISSLPSKLGSLVYSRGPPLLTTRPPQLLSKSTSKSPLSHSGTLPMPHAQQGLWEVLRGASLPSQGREPFLLQCSRAILVMGTRIILLPWILPKYREAQIPSALQFPDLWGVAVTALQDSAPTLLSLPPQGRQTNSSLSFLF